MSNNSGFESFNLSSFYGKRKPPTPQACKGVVIRHEPQSDSDESDVFEDSEDEYLPSQDEDELIKHDLLSKYAELGELGF
ncbi:hypothetical protein Pmani_035053 [Petrolisthes manimaculis]|uniref:Uncharacterized protein n=1 Tax=Petrolisthes manimaculis TaxID=1843537 RepID=A0AAE1NMG3_9EUCA|nr:hypothetical protein Pmani_035053 [Petrolisthes manimaculis]